MSDVFRDLLKKVGSGSHTSKELSRDEAATATRLMLMQAATPAQIGAFMIAHRIRRPTGEEMAGLLDAYAEIGPHLEPIEAPYPALVMGIPYDGRSRTCPVSPLVALLLATVGCPVVQHGGERMPTKYGIPLVEVWQALGIDWTRLSLNQAQQVFAATKLSLLYLPNHFPAAHALLPFRDQIGKRPPFATAELMWCPYLGDALLLCGYVHPPTEDLVRTACTLRHIPRLITIKGLEGSCDLPRDRTNIIGIHQSCLQEPHLNPPGPTVANSTFERLLLHPRDYNMAAPEVPLVEGMELSQALTSVLAGAQTEMTKAVVWNAGFGLWQCGYSEGLAAGLEAAAALLQSGKVAHTLNELQRAIATQS